ncbi:hypothetical protein GUJ93_ZPchr0010g7956 [Zizania palustris]|uniref:Uncharacterized protein n=1 Tax=Zizania palustris TaxID=103762 RepID=A0A8J5WCK1_ZIZPA|nr:hypothetical protein GUJ93_ZPchr0010g7956 [Zizania palustris]
MHNLLVRIFQFKCLFQFQFSSPAKRSLPATSLYDRANCVLSPRHKSVLVFVPRSLPSVTRFLRFCRLDDGPPRCVCSEWRLLHRNSISGRFWGGRLEGCVLVGVLSF